MSPVAWAPPGHPGAVDAAPVPVHAHPAHATVTVDLTGTRLLACGHGVLTLTVADAGLLADALADAVDEVEDDRDCTEDHDWGTHDRGLTCEAAAASASDELTAAVTA